MMDSGGNDDSEWIDHLRHHRDNEHLWSPFGGDWFARVAEAFARFFGTPIYLVFQTALTCAWMGFNSYGIFHFDLYPFILLNLAYSIQSGYAAPLILLAQTRQAARDSARIESDSKHREEIALSSAKNAEQILNIVKDIKSILEKKE